MEPELEGFAGEVGAKFLNQDVLEVAMLAFAKKLPDVLVAESSEGSDLEFEEVVLRGVQVDCVNSAWVCKAEGKDIVACRSNS